MKYKTQQTSCSVDSTSESLGYSEFGTPDVSPRFQSEQLSVDKEKVDASCQAEGVSDFLYMRNIRMLQEEISDNETALTQLEGYAMRLEWDNQCSTRCLEEEAKQHQNILNAIDSKVSNIEAMLYSISAETAETVKLQALKAIEECRLLASSRDHRVVQTWLHAVKFDDLDVPPSLKNKVRENDLLNEPIVENSPKPEVDSSLVTSDFFSSTQTPNREVACSCALM
eukprot:TRINITY_DN440_c2_g1_i2.p1 TRINITY_DN440_c2_g1~~TRINITY_DN440_c2_g1_i2.p1  ORF type:complete len:226 (+),score=46.86 TRINITY_DN440_c2_g1_i2:77-754(+)